MRRGTHCVCDGAAAGSCAMKVSPGPTPAGSTAAIEVRNGALAHLPGVVEEITNVRDDRLRDRVEGRRARGHDVERLRVLARAPSSSSGTRAADVLAVHAAAS